VPVAAAAPALAPPAAVLEVDAAAGSVAAGVAGLAGGRCGVVGGFGVTAPPPPLGERDAMEGVRRRLRAAAPCCCFPEEDRVRGSAAGRPVASLLHSRSTVLCIAPALHKEEHFSVSS